MKEIIQNRFRVYLMVVNMCGSSKMHANANRSSKWQYINIKVQIKKDYNPFICFNKYIFLYLLNLKIRCNEKCVILELTRQVSDAGQGGFGSFLVVKGKHCLIRNHENAGFLLMNVFITYNQSLKTRSPYF